MGGRFLVCPCIEFCETKASPPAVEDRGHYLSSHEVPVDAPRVLWRISKGILAWRSCCCCCVSGWSIRAVISFSPFPPGVATTCIGNLVQWLGKDPRDEGGGKHQEHIDGNNTQGWWNDRMAGEYSQRFRKLANSPEFILRLSLTSMTCGSVGLDYLLCSVLQYMAVFQPPQCRRVSATVSQLMMIRRCMYPPGCFE